MISSSGSPLFPLSERARAPWSLTGVNSDKDDPLCAPLYMNTLTFFLHTPVADTPPGRFPELKALQCMSHRRNPKRCFVLHLICHLDAQWNALQLGPSLHGHVELRVQKGQMSKSCMRKMPADKLRHKKGQKYPWDRSESVSFVSCRQPSVALK